MVIASPFSKKEIHTVDVDLEADMSVLAAFIAATRAYISEHGRREDIPFNLMLDYDKQFQCFTIVKALGLNSRRRAAWFITVTNSANQVCSI